MDDKDIEKLHAIRDNCKLCKGLGYTTTRNEDGNIQVIDCKCVLRIQDEIKLIEAHIPPRYRRWSFKKLTSEFKDQNKRSLGIVKKYIENLDTNLKRGTGLYFHSQPGLGKSAIICNILKKAMRKGHVAYYGLAFEMVSLKFRALRNDPIATEILRHILDRVEILALEELEKVYLADAASMPNQIFNELILNIYDANIALLVSSNVIRPKYEKSLPPFIQDRFKNLTSVTLIGKSARTDLRKES